MGEAYGNAPWLLVACCWKRLQGLIPRFPDYGSRITKQKNLTQRSQRSQRKGSSLLNQPLAPSPRFSLCVLE